MTTSIAVNFTKTPNRYFELMPKMSESVMKVVGTVIRHTSGFHKIEAGISYTDFIKDTGLSREAIKQAIKHSREKRYIKLVTSRRGKNGKFLYQIGESLLSNQSKIQNDLKRKPDSVIGLKSRTIKNQIGLKSRLIVNGIVLKSRTHIFKERLSKEKKEKKEKKHLISCYAQSWLKTFFLQKLFSVFQADQEPLDEIPEIEPETTELKSTGKKLSDWQITVAATKWTFELGENAYGYAGKLANQLLGKTKTGERANWLIQPPMDAVEIVGLGMWTYDVKGRDSPPTTAETLQERVLEYRGSNEYEEYQNLAPKKLKVTVLGEPEPDALSAQEYQDAEYDCASEEEIAAAYAGIDELMETFGL